MFGCGLLAVLAVALAMIPTLSSGGWSLTALPRVDSRTTLGADARTVDPGFRTTRTDAYDGQFYWGTAVDPLAVGAVHNAFDKPSYRYGHPLYGWLGWILSAGQSRSAAAALAVVGVASLFAAAVAAAALGLGRGRSGWEGLFVALNPGLISSAVHDLAEPLATAVVLGSFLAYVRGRRALAWIGFALLPLAKEPLVLVICAVVGWELIQRRGRVAAAFAAAAIPALVWWSYARIHLGAWFTSGGTALASPLSGWHKALFETSSTATRSAAVAVLVVLLIVLTFAALRALRSRGPVELSYLALFAVALCLAPNATVAFSTALRNTSFLLALVPFVLVLPSLVPISRVRNASGAATRHRLDV
jgi:hypothetical protein